MPKCSYSHGDPGLVKRVRGACSYYRQLNEPARLNLRVRVDELIEQIGKSIRKSNEGGYRRWVKDALQNGAGIAHRWTAGTPKAPSLPDSMVMDVETTRDPCSMAVHHAKTWEKY